MTEEERKELRRQQHIRTVRNIDIAVDVAAWAVPILLIIAGIYIVSYLR